MSRQRDKQGGRATTIWKSTMREIRQSFGRFFAIMAIVALGVGFFAGLKVTKPAMVETAEQYFEELQFYDYRLLSTLGFEQQDVDYIADNADARAVEGAVSFDIIAQIEEGNEMVVKAHSLMENINGIRLLEGRMPESPNECVVDGNLFDSSAIGQTLQLAENNEEDDLEHFASREYTITGIVKSSLYIQFERGNTSLGTGRIAGFVYLLPEGFDTDYYTEVYVKFNEDFPLYSEEYEEFIDGRQGEWESLTALAAQSRYERVVAEAEEELKDATEELETERADAEAELASAKEELEDAAVQLADGEQKLADAKVELADAGSTLAQKEAELADGRQTLAESEAELADGEQTLKDNWAEYEKQRKTLEDAKATMEEGTAQLAGQEAALTSQEEALLAGESALNSTEAQLNAQKQQLVQESAALDALEASFGGNPIPADVAAQISAGRAQIAAGNAGIDAGLAQIAGERAQVEQGKLAIAQGRVQIAAYRQELEAGRSQITAGAAALDSAYMQLADAQKELEDGRAELEEAKAEIADGEQQIADAKKELADGERTIAENEAELADAKIEYEDGLKEYEDGVAEFNTEIADAEEKIADARQELADLESPDTFVLGRDTNIGYVFLDNDSSIVEGIANIFPIFFFLVAALVCVTTMNRMVEEQRTQIGVLKALGYSDGIIMSKYIVYSGSAAILGCVGGFLGGTYLFPRVIWTAYGIMYRIDSLVYIFDWRLALLTLFVSLLCSVGTTWISCRYELFQVAAELMRPKAPRAGKRVLLERIPFIWKHLGFLKKVSVRNIFRYKKRLFMMIIGISGCTALLVTGYGVKDSIANVATQQFEEIQVYDINLALLEPTNAEMEQDILENANGSIEEYLPVMETTMDLVAESGVKAVSLVVAEKGTDMSDFVKLHTTDKGRTPIAFPGEGQVVLTHKIAEDYNIKVGDSITLRNENMETITATVSGICRNFIYNYAFLSSDTYSAQMGVEPEYKTLYLNGAEGTDMHLLSATLMKLDGISSVSVNTDSMGRFNSMIESLDLIVLVVIICAAGLAFIVLYNLTNINITERVREIATIKVLGFYKKETASYVFRENVVLTFMGAVLGLVLGHFLHLFVMNEIRIDMVSFDIHVRPISYCYSILLTFAFAWFVNMFMGRKLDRISMTESLKSVD